MKPLYSNYYRLMNNNKLTICVMLCCIVLCTHAGECQQVVLMSTNCIGSTCVNVRLVKSYMLCLDNEKRYRACKPDAAHKQVRTCVRVCSTTSGASHQTACTRAQDLAQQPQSGVSVGENTLHPILLTVLVQQQHHASRDFTKFSCYKSMT